MWTATDLRDRQITNLIGIGDNILYLMRRLGIKGGENRVDSAAMHAFYDKLSQMTIDQIEENFGVNSEYAALLLPAATVYTRILDITGAEMFWIPAIGICDGIAAEYASDKKLIRFDHNFEKNISVMPAIIRCWSSMP